ncbi:MAG: 6-bladed beta-propeller, partial [Bacteroidales bacterium]|nr:6-bladed beta-propeller [Parabacteroides sp.]MDY6255872.1 6-bladed beta-propeller [Bacteroidales bacterium]
MKTLIFIETIFLLVMTSCGSDNASTDGFITVDVTKSSYSPKKELVLQDFMDVEYIPLETNDEFVNQGYVQAVGEKYIIVSNYRKDGDIFVYNRKGKAIRKINRKGQGAEEYISFSGITLDEENDELFVNDHHAKRIEVYDLEGNFKRSFKQNDKGNSQFYWGIFNYDKENLICYDICND